MNDQNVIFLVGADMCGKTQIAQALSQKLQIPYFKPSEERQTFVNNQSKFLFDLKYADPRMADFLWQSGYSVVFDRGFPCEWVYSKLLNRETDDVALRHVDNVYASIGAKIVVTYRSSYVGIIDDIDSSLKEEKLEVIDRLYREFAKWSNCSVMFLNVDSENLDWEVEEICKFLHNGGEK